MSRPLCPHCLQDDCGWVAEWRRSGHNGDADDIEWCPTAMTRRESGQALILLDSMGRRIHVGDVLIAVDPDGGQIDVTGPHGGRRLIPADRPFLIAGGVLLALGVSTTDHELLQIALDRIGMGEDDGAARTVIDVALKVAFRFPPTGPRNIEECYSFQAGVLAERESIASLLRREAHRAGALCDMIELLADLIGAAPRRWHDLAKMLSEFEAADGVRAET